MNELYSETAAECAEPYFCYGRALLELARMERGVIENMDEAGRNEYIRHFLGRNNS